VTTPHVSTVCVSRLRCHWSNNIFFRVMLERALVVRPQVQILLSDTSPTVW